MSRHFHQIIRREHGVTVSYSFVKKALPAAHLVRKGRARARHRRRREPRPCVGELVHLDGSRHAWLALVPDTMPTLIVAVDDATSRLLYAQLTEEGESAAVIMTALRAVLESDGIPGALYTDRAGWARYTPTSGTAPDRSKLTQVGRALATLGIEHIVGYSPQARGRSERANGTLQGRLVNELRVAGIRTLPAANQYLRERFIPDYNAPFGRPPADPTSAFAPVGAGDLEQILCHEEERTVARDNTVRLDGVVLQIDKQRGRRSCAGLRVLVRRHLDGRHSIWWGPRCLGRYTATGRRVEPGPAGGYRHSGPPPRPAALSLRGPRLPPTSAPKVRGPAYATLSAALGRCRRPGAVPPERSPGDGALSGQIICQTRADRSLVNNSGQAPSAHPSSRSTGSRGRSSMISE
jgi:hypothetical protein